MKNPFSHWSWWQVSRLSWDNCLRQHYRDQRHGRDPNDNLFFAGCSVLIFIISLTTTIKAELIFIALPSLWQIMIVLLIPISLVICSGACFSYNAYVQHIKKVSNCLYQHIPDLDNFSETAVRQSARTRLIYLAKTLLDLEKDNPPYFREVVMAKADFERAYRILLEAGLIQDVGYGEFFRA